MNIFQLIFKLKRIRAETYLSPIDQALYYELISISNELHWQPVFAVKSEVLCQSLNISDRTLHKSRKALADAGLIHFMSCRSKRVGCYYSFEAELKNGLLFSIEEQAGKAEKEVEEKKQIRSASSEQTSENSTEEEKSTPINTIKTINNRDNIPTYNSSFLGLRLAESAMKDSTGKKKKESFLRFPFFSERFSETWNELVRMPKWRKKPNSSLQRSLDRLANYEEGFAIEQMERAIESNWAGVIFTETEERYQQWITKKYQKHESTKNNKSNSTYRAERQESVNNLAKLAGEVLRRIASDDHEGNNEE